jgi:voltage-gated potassium channel
LGPSRPARLVVGSGTDPEPLHDAGVEAAVGIVAGTEDDANNLSVIMTARAINPKIFQVARQNKRTDSEIFSAANLDLVMEPSRVLAWRVLALVTEPLLVEFLAIARRQHEAWGQMLLQRLRVVGGNRTPRTWTVTFSEQQAPALLRVVEKNKTVHIRDLMADPSRRDERLPAIALLHVSDGEQHVLPPEDRIVAPGDQILWAAREDFRARLAWLLHNPDQLEFLMDGQERPTGAVGRWFAKRSLKRLKSAA